MKPTYQALFPALGVALLLGGSLFAQESTDELVKKLRGSAGVTTRGASPTSSKDDPTGGLKTRGLGTRGLTTRSITPSQPKTRTEKRSVVFTARGVPASVKVAAEEDEVEVETTTAKKSNSAGDYSVSAGEKAVEVTYEVDADSKVIRDNILFRKGSTEFANDASFDVVAQLAQALKDPSLADLKFVVEGHASAEGSAAANQDLSQRRAERIVSVLGSLGVDDGKLLPVGHGEQEARFPAHSEESLLRQDRRVLVFRRVH